MVFTVKITTEASEERMIKDVDVGGTTLILETGASVHFRSEVGDTALMVAVRRNFVGLVELLLRHGADPNVACSAFAMQQDSELQQ